MTRLRQRIAERLKDAQDTAAMLTTFNEVDMSAVIELRPNTGHLRKSPWRASGVHEFFVNPALPR